MGRGTLTGVCRTLLYAGLLLTAAVAAVGGGPPAALAKSGGHEIPASGTVVAHGAPISMHISANQSRSRQPDRRPLSGHPAELKAAKDAADRRARGKPSSAGAGGSALAPSVGSSPAILSGLQGSGLSDLSYSPSDSTGDIGPGNYVEMVNSDIGIYDRSLGLVASAPLRSFAPLGPYLTPAVNDCIADPQVAWDQQAGRWEFSMLDMTVSGSCASFPTGATGDYLEFGWSKTSDPLGAWCHYYFPTGSDIPDYDKLGHDNNFIEIGANIFGAYGAGNQFLGAAVYAIGKPPAGSTTCPNQLTTAVFGDTLGQPTSLAYGDGVPAMTPVPADVTDSSTVGYIVSAEDPSTTGASRLGMWHVVSVGGVPHLYQDSDVTVQTYTVPPPVPQPSTGANSCSSFSTCLDSLDGRLTQAVAHFDPSAGGEAVWTQHAIADSTGPLSVERWYELIPGRAAPQQSGDVSDPALYVFDGAVSPATAGNEAVIFYDTASSASPVAYKAQRRNAATPAGTMANEVVIASSTTSDADFTCGFMQAPASGTPCRWGDYSAARPDPTNANTVWGAGMIVGNNGGGASTSGWATEISRMTPGCLTATLTNSTPQSSATRGDTVTFTASATDCANPQYQFWLRNPDGSWSIKQAFSSANTWTWDTSGYSIGASGQVYPVVVWVTQAGDSQSTWDVYAANDVTLTGPVPCSQASIGGSPTAPVSAGTPINFAASVGVGSCTAPRFQFWLQAVGGPWQIMQPFAAGNSWLWQTAGYAPGPYNIVVWANQAGDPTSTYEAFAEVNVTLTGCASVTATPSAPSPQQTGNPITITASASGCANPMYQFWLLAPGSSTWKVARSYSTTATFAWPTAKQPVGNYNIAVWVQDASSGGAAGNSLGRWDAYTSFPYTLTPASCSSISLATSPSGTALVGTPVTISATAAGCSNPNPLYQFWLLPPGSSTWQLVQPYSSSASYSWGTSGQGGGTWSVAVWVRDDGSPGLNSGSLGRWDALASTTYTLTSNPCTRVSVASSPAGTAAAGTFVTLTATASGPCANPRYQFWMLAPGSSTWQLVQAYSTTNTFTWTPSSAAKGKYQFSVWVRDASSQGTGSSSLGTWDAYQAIPYTVT